MTPNSKTNRLLPMLGLFLIIAGYLYFVIAGVNLNKQIDEKKNEISLRNQELADIESKISQKNKELELKNEELEKTRKVIEKEAPQMVTKIDSINENYQKKIYGLDKDNTFKVTPIKQRSAAKAAEWEKKGFEFLVSKNVDAAISAFRKSENAYNGYKSVYEIAKYLQRHKTELQNPNSAEWEVTYRKMAKDFNWKMPANIEQQMMQPEQQIRKR
jgi:hypothetical protein